MRNEFSKKVQELIQTNPNSVFITGDLGYNALEQLQQTAGERFVNAGVAEQNMVGVAAGLAYKGFETFVYSIAPFAVYRCFEQIKIDVCIHNLPVYIVGNGGGYGYGIMGATHHAIEDIGCLSTLPNITCWIPAFNEDVDYCLEQITNLKKPAYLRLGMSKTYPIQQEIKPVNHVVKSENPEITIIALGPIVNNVIDAISDKKNVDVFTILTVPLPELTAELFNSISSSNTLIVVEEHVERGGLGEHLLSHVFKKGVFIKKFVGLNAKGYPSKLYGNQAFHQQENGLDTESIKKQIESLLLETV
ncbi:MAG: transketolase C-terminal domain-containing protein [Bacteroidia bacterium]